jgi:hypothetical protein
MSDELAAALKAQADAEAELAAARKLLKDAEDALRAAGGNPAKVKARASKASARKDVHHPESGLKAGIWGHGGPAPVGESRIRYSSRPVVTKHLDPTDRPVSDEYKPKECLLMAAVDAGTSLTGIRCRCAGCSN